LIVLQIKREKKKTETGLFHLYNFFNLVASQAGGADFYGLHFAFDFGFNLVEIREKLAFGGIHGMASMITYLTTFSTYITYSRHTTPSL
jgi:hypothetical protein